MSENTYHYSATPLGASRSQDTMPIARGSAASPGSVMQ
uniref:Uncharacterized protein n=1 Tax=Setaria italica TaxID=4555 RepID=K3Y438_SETIT